MSRIAVLLTKEEIEFLRRQLQKSFIDYPFDGPWDKTLKILNSVDCSLFRALEMNL